MQDSARNGQIVAFAFDSALPSESACGGSQAMRACLQCRVECATLLRLMNDAAHIPAESGPWRISVLVLGIALASLTVALTIAPLVSDRGVAGPLVTDSARLGLGLSVLIGAFVVIVAIGAVVGRHVNAVVGLFAVGAGLSVLSMRSGNVEDLMFGSSRLASMPFESLAWAALLGVASFAIFRFAGRLPDFPIQHERDIDAIAGKSAMRSWIAGIAAPILASLIVANVMKGQALGAAIVGSMVVGIIGRMLAPQTQPVFLVCVPVIAAAAGQAFFIFNGLAAPADQLVAQTLPRLMYITPIDWAAGALVGVPLGFGWARSFVKQEA